MQQKLTFIVYLKGASLWHEPIEEVVIPHTHAANGEGKEIPLFVRLPQGIKEGGEEDCPVVLLLTGLDGHRPDNTGVGAFLCPHPRAAISAISMFLRPIPTLLADC